MSSTSMLSPLAVPFKPTREGYTEFASFAAIYNDGIPAGVVCGSHADHYVLHNIPDEAIDEIFPPDALGTYTIFLDLNCLDLHHHRINPIRKTKCRKILKIVLPCQIIDRNSQLSFTP